MRASNRETCIWEMPISAAICDCVIPRKNRRVKMCFSRGSSASSSGLIVSRFSTCSSALSSPDDVDHRQGAVVAGVGCVQGQGRVGVRGLQALDDLLVGDPDPAGELGDRGGASQLLGQVGGGRGDREPQLLEPARHADRPATVAEVPLDLADDRGSGVGRELHPAAGVEPVDRLDQADGADLEQVVERLTPVEEPPGEVLHEGQVQRHQLAAQLAPLGITGAVVAELCEQLRAPGAHRHQVVP